ncbi:hypothetical protein FGO68_gene17413 [Halteria grandinella]|uniref:Uncharacterized protein n=1 Tax=Halteria grandinella TaxID=5974 RepID=A0A8J8P755_HALGN|nr:hypothetical protein FGO68_gene17413 [Halteria grandinella]
MLSLININMPGQASLITSIIMDLVYMDLLQTDLWFDNIIDLESCEDQALCPSFQLAGYSSMNTIRNLGSTFIFMFILVALQILLVVIKLANNIFKNSMQDSFDYHQLLEQGRSP